MLSCGGRTPSSLNRPLTGFAQQITSSIGHLRMRSGQTIQLPVRIKNTGADIWVGRGAAPVMLSYRWLSNENILPADGERTVLPRVIVPGESVALEARVTAPEAPGDLVLAVSMVQEGVAWFFTSGGTALRIPVNIVADDHAGQPLTIFADEITSSVTHLVLKPLENVKIPVTVRNVTSRPWSSSGAAPVLVSYVWFTHGRMIATEGARTALPGIVRPGEAVSLLANVSAPSQGRDLVLKITLVQEGVAWFITKGAKTLDIPVTLQ